VDDVVEDRLNARLEQFQRLVVADRHQPSVEVVGEVRREGRMLPGDPDPVADAVEELRLRLGQAVVQVRDAGDHLVVHHATSGSVSR
jgi:alkanesulfonate monooxygenase SsuD/methylene tetrahydromethanopterin reductase-like flavin-dependent oxidoreductase (luciferase family)